MTIEKSEPTSRSREPSGIIWWDCKALLIQWISACDTIQIIIWAKPRVEKTLVFAKTIVSAKSLSLLQNMYLSKQKPRMTLLYSNPLLLLQRTGIEYIPSLSCWYENELWKGWCIACRKEKRKWKNIKIWIIILRMMISCIEQWESFTVPEKKFLEKPSS